MGKKKKTCAPLCFTLPFLWKSNETGFKIPSIQARYVMQIKSVQLQCHTAEWFGWKGPQCGTTPGPCSSRAVPRHAALGCVQMVLGFISGEEKAATPDNLFHCEINRAIKTFVLIFR